MLFSTWQFIIAFLPATLGIFLLIPARHADTRRIWLVAASLFFYGWWKPAFVPLLVFSMGFNHAAASLIDRHRGRSAAQRVLVAAIAVDLLLLGYYKYTNFILGSLGWAFRFELRPFDIVLPLAISFFTFTQIGYLVDVFRSPEARCRPLDYVFFVVFFPHLIAGPIVRHWEIIPQIRNRRFQVTSTDLAVGLAFFLCGLYKKVLLADPVGAHANAVYAAAEAGAVLPWFDAWLGTLA